MTTVRVAPLGGPSLMTVVRPPASAAEAAAAAAGAGGAGHGTDARPGRASPPVDPGAAAVRYDGDNGAMRVISANVNGIRAAARRGGLSWLAAAEPDVLCLQEVRASDAQLAAALADARFAGWHVAHAPCGTAGRAGVAVLSRDRAPARPVRAGGRGGRRSRPAGGSRPSSTCRPAR